MDIKTAQRQLIALITSHLNESIPVTRILTYKPSSNGAVTGRFESSGRVYNFVFNGRDARYKPALNADSALFSEYYLDSYKQHFDAVVAPVKSTRALPKCTSKSYSCKGNVGVRCLPLTQNCKMGTSDIGNERLSKIKKLSSELAESVMFDIEPDPKNQKNLANLQKSQAAIVEKRMALAAENRAKREPKNLNPKQNASQNISIEELRKGLESWETFHKKNNQKDWYDQDNFEDQITVADYIKEEGVLDRGKDTEHIGIVGKNGKLQAALTGKLDKEKGFYIDNLATAPWNLSPENNADKEKGSGAKAIIEAIKKSKSAGFGGKVSLEALPAAIPFYEHLGFTLVKKGKNDYVLNPDAADKLIKKYGGID